ncbi:MAG: DUF5107 domain-containing protein [Planctomycetota bacterium]
MHPVTVRRTVLTLPTYQRHPARRLPYLFRDDWLNSFPDTQDDVLGGPKIDQDYDAIVLENEFLRLTILPQLGGKLWSVFDKQARQEAVYVPDCIKPGLIHRAGAWIPGGMEFNFPIGHHIMTMRPIPCAILEAGPDHGVALIQRTCARSGLRMDLRIGLKAGEARFTIDGEMFNPTPLRHRFYHWTNVGCWAHKDWRFFSKAQWYFTGSTLRKYPIDDDGIDISWVKDRPLPCDSFMVGHREDFFGCYDYRREHGLCSVAPWQELQGKKYFTWGMESREYDSERNLADDGRNYLEIQTGPLETQQQFAFLNPGQSRNFHATWIPFAKIGGIEWADRDLIFHVRDGAPWVYAAAPQAVELRIGARHFPLKLRAGEARRLPVKVNPGDRIAIADADAIAGALRREFAYPLEGRLEPGAEKKWRGRKFWEPLPENPTARQRHEYGLELARADHYTGAVEQFRAAVKQDPKLHAARFDLADALWHIGDFAAGAREFARLAKTPFAADAALRLARQAEAEAAFAGPVEQLPPGPARDLALAERLAGYGGYATALQIYRRLLKSEPRNPRVHYGLARYFHFVKRDRRRALDHALAALKLQPHDRDILLELAPVLRDCGAWTDLRAAILAAPKPVRELAILQKLLAEAHCELGEDAKAFAIGSTRTLFLWEGEYTHADTYMDATLALLENALQRNDAASVKKYAAAIQTWPVGLGILRRFLNQPKVGYWQGRVAASQGRQADAERIWRQALADFAAERALIATTHGDWWTQWFSPSIRYHLGLIAVALGDAKELESAIALIAPPPTAEVLAKLRKPAYRKRHERRNLLRDGLVAELRAEYPLARKKFTAYLKQARAKRFAQMHLAAVSRGRRCGE